MWINKNNEYMDKKRSLRILSHNPWLRFTGILMFSIIGSSALFGVTNKAQAKDDISVYSTSFEEPIFHKDDLLLGIDGWSTQIPPFLNPDAAQITDATSSNRKQSVVVRGADLVGSGGITTPYDAVGSYRRPLDEVIDRKVRVEADLMLETDQPATDDQFFSLTIAARSGDGESLGEVGLTSAGLVEAFGFNAAPGAIPPLVKPILLNRWYHISMLLDYENRTTSYYINGHLLGKIAAPSASNVLSRVALVVYARPDGEGKNRDDYVAHFDDLRVEANNPVN